ncbi:MAG TPA: CoA transferase [Solirubrobacteraceae bacterium]|nr:CoA transferase [Solirubrobacteraceae bacterium]
MAETAARAPLDGVRVLDFTTAMAGPTASMLLADFGASVVKVEPPEGESSRRWGVARFGAAGDLSGLFAALNRNKASITVDLKSAAGLAAVRALAAEADVVIESFKPGVAQRLGIGYEQLSQEHPELVYCSVSGFGQTGPLREQPGYDQLLQAYAGHMSVTGEPGQPSVRIGPSAIDLLTGAHAAYGIVLALRERARSGRGQQLETSLYDSSLHLITHFIADYTGSGMLPGKLGGDFAFLAPYGMFAGSDREFYMGVGTDTMFAKLCDALEAPKLAEDPRFATNGARLEHRDELTALLAPRFLARDANHWVELCRELGIPASLVNDLAEVLEQEQALAREMVVATGIPGVRSAGIPVKLDRTPGSIRRPPPALGADNGVPSPWPR